MRKESNSRDAAFLEECETLLQILDPGQNLVLRLHAEAGQTRKFVFPAGPLEFSNGGQTQLFVDGTDLLGPHTRYAQHLQKTIRDFVQGVIVEKERSRRQ